MLNAAPGENVDDFKKSMFMKKQGEIAGMLHNGYVSADTDKFIFRPVGSDGFRMQRKPDIDRIGFIFFQKVIQSQIPFLYKRIIFDKTVCEKSINLIIYSHGF